ncbi:phage tail-collar fiber domain-containing protein [Phaeobacter piscinae]|uniref:phage tail-collar fiber domain-containing protein n=1 Tax=Phaeobacter piscinae TaxID=1580596 RepID=UPI00058DFE4F|nr:phage tail protein [Phaeobacter piscinae]UTS79570.1 hypothetical protein OL67_000617 [Phaeobacter piscinae]
MSTEPYGFLTTAGRAANAAALATGAILPVAEIAWGDGTRAITGGEAALENETGRAPVAAWSIDPANADVALFHHYFAADDGPFVIAEAGLFDADGTMLAIVTYPTPFAKPLNFNPELVLAVAFSDLENLQIELTAPSSLVPAPRKIIAGNGLAGGGDLSQDRTLALDPDLLARFESDLLPEGDREAGDMLRISEAGEPEWVAGSGLLGGSSLDGPASIYAGTSAEYIITDYDAFTAYVVTATRGTVARDAERITLTLDANEAAGPLTLTVDRGGSETAIEIAVLANIVMPPSIDAPLSGATDIGPTPSLATSAFASIPDGADTHASTDWQIASDNGFANVLWEALASADLELTNVPSGTLDVGTTYYLRARHNGDTLGASDWSVPVSFTTSATFVPMAEVQVLTGFDTGTDSAVQIDGDWLAGIDDAETGVDIYHRTGGAFVFNDTLPVSKGGYKTFGLNYPWIALPNGADTKVYRHEGGAWVEKQTLAGNTCIVMRGGRLVITTGAVAKVYELAGEVWTETAEITAPWAINILDLNGDRLLLGKSGTRSNFYRLENGVWGETGYYNNNTSHTHTFAINGAVAAYRDLGGTGFMRIVNADGNNQQLRYVTGPTFDHGITIDDGGNVYTINDASNGLLVYEEGDGSWPLLREIAGNVPNYSIYNQSIAQSGGTVVAISGGQVNVFS